jgi:hypothetical protein
VAPGLHRQLDDLHEMIYRRGGIRPVNAAIEELAKLVILVLKLEEDPTCRVPGHGTLESILRPEAIAAGEDVAALKAAFRHVASLPDYAGRLPDGSAQPIWPADEPLRITRPDVLAESVRILRLYMDPGDGVRLDVIGTAFDVFLRGRYDHSGGLGTHLTPHTVTETLARICLTDLDIASEPFAAPIVGDPCCGTGRFLMAAVNEIAPDSEDPRRSKLLARGLFGADQSSSSVAKARVNLLLMGARSPNIFVVGDSIVDRYVDAYRGELRLILTNPPFGEGKYDSEAGIGRAGAIFPTLAMKRRIDPALAFVARCLELLRDGGRLGIVLPDGLVDGSALREVLLATGSARVRDISVEANISLPPVTFALAGTVARTSALVLRKQAAQRGHVFLGRAEHVGYLKQGPISVPDPAGNDLPAIADAAEKALSRKIAVAGVRFVSRRPLAAIVPARDIVTLDPAQVDPRAVAARGALRKNGIPFRDMLRVAQRRQGLALRRQGLAVEEGVPFVSVLHIDDLGAVAWHESCAYRPSTPGLEARSGDVIFSLLNPRKLRATVIPVGIERVLCSSEFGVFEPLRDPHEVLVLLHHPSVRDQLAPMGRGTSSSRRRIKSEDLLEVLAPRVSSARLAPLAVEVREALGGLMHASSAVASAYATVGSLGI